MKQDSAYVVIEVHKCSPKTWKPGYPQCAPSRDIDAFIETKQICFKVLNEKIDFIEREGKAVRYAESFLPVIQMQSGVFSDTGHRMRFNYFERTDFWWSKSQKIIDKFYDYVFYSSDTYDVPKTNTVIAEIYFRLDSNQVTHRRIVFSFMDFVSSMGGIERVLLKICGVVYSGYASFWSVFSTIGMLYKLRSESKIFDKTEDEDI